MKYLITTFLSFLFTAAIVAQTPSREKAIRAIWLATEMDNSQIEIYETKDRVWYGKVVKSDDANAIGKMIFRNGKYDASTQKWVGELVKPDNGMIISAELTLENDSKLKVKGSKYFLTKTFYWTKLN